MVGELGGRGRARRSPSSRAVGAAGVASTTPSTRITSGSRVEPTTSSKPVVGAPQLADGGVGPRREPALSTSASASRPMPPGRPANTGSSEVGSSAAASSSEPPRPSRVTSCGVAARADSSRA